MCFVPFCVKASEWQVQKNVLSHESLRMKDFEKNMLGGGQEPVTVVQVVDNRRLAATEACVHKTRALQPKKPPQ